MNILPLENQRAPAISLYLKLLCLSQYSRYLNYGHCHLYLLLHISLRKRTAGEPAYDFTRVGTRVRIRNILTGASQRSIGAIPSLCDLGRVNKLELPRTSYSQMSSDIDSDFRDKAAYLWESVDTRVFVMIEIYIHKIAVQSIPFILMNPGYRRRFLLRNFNYTLTSVFSVQLWVLILMHKTSYFVYTSISHHQLEARVALPKHSR